MSAEVILFWAFAALTLLSALVVVVARSPMHCALSLVASFFFLAGLYVLLWAHTVAVLQVLVYAGAIMVLFLFVIMLLSLVELGPGSKLSFSRLLGMASALWLFLALGGAMLKLRGPQVDWAVDPARAESFGTIRALGQLLFTSYLLPFEAVSVLLLVAIVGAVVVAKPRI